MEFSWHSYQIVTTFFVIIVCGPRVVYAQLTFGQGGREFQLTASRYYFRFGDDVTFTCIKSGSQNNDRTRSLVFPDDKGVTWERNNQPLFSTSKVGGGSCRVQAESVLRRPAVTSRDLEAVTCVDDVTSVRLTIRNVTVSPGGDRWACTKFPFMESNEVVLYNYAPVSAVSLTVRDHFPDDVSTGVLLTLSCQSSPSSPPPVLSWTLQAADGRSLPLPDRVRTSSQHDALGRLVVTMELAFAADPRYHNATASCNATNANVIADASPEAAGSSVASNVVTVNMKRAPRILLTALPSNRVTEGADVTLNCGAHGHPTPEVRWRKDGGFLPGGLKEADTPILRLTPARTPDQGAYICTASNGVAPDAVNSVYLAVDEPKRPLQVTDQNRSTESTTPTKASDTNPTVESRLAQTDASTRDSGGNNSGTIAAVVISVLVVIIAVAVAAFVVLYLRRQRKRNFMSPTNSSDSLFTHYPNRSLSTPRPGLYAPRSSLRPTTQTLVNLDFAPQYLELPPAPRPPDGIVNGGYGLSSNRRKSDVMDNRPLPAAPIGDQHNVDAGYDEIRDVGPVTSWDGYEVPVLAELEEEEEEEESIYDVARPELMLSGQPDSGPAGPRPGPGCGAVYSNQDSLSAQSL